MKTLVYSLILLTLTACSKDDTDSNLKVDDFVFFKINIGSATKELHSKISPGGRVDGLIYAWQVQNDTAFLNISSQIISTVGNPNFSFSISSTKKGSEIKGSYSDGAFNNYQVLLGLDELTIKAGTVKIEILSTGNNSKYGNYIEGSITMTMTKFTDTTYTETASGTFRLKEL